MQLSRRDDAVLLPEPMVLHLLHRVPLHRAVLHHEPGESSVLALLQRWALGTDVRTSSSCVCGALRNTVRVPRLCATIAVDGAGLHREAVLTAASFPPYSKRFALMKPARHCA